MTAASCRLSDGMLTSSSVRAARSEAAMTEGIMAVVAVHQPDPSPGSEPERGFVVAVLGQGVDPDEGLGGGVGTRGPGESQLETDRRIARRRISILRRRLAALSKQRDIRRKERRRTETPTVALAGYTNVGKSTLLNALTDAEVSVENRLFETLDPTTRGFEHDGRRYLVTDTVGFVRRLPHQLVEGFAATLEETLVADLVLHVVDGSVSESTLIEQIAAVDSVLHEIGADELPIELVINKLDAVDAEHRRRPSNRYPEACQISAQTGAGLE